MMQALLSILTFWGVILLQAAATVDFWTLLEKHGFPTVALALAIWFIWNRQKKSDKERNELMAQNIELTKTLITEVKAGNQCKWSEQHGKI